MIKLALEVIENMRHLADSIETLAKSMEGREEAPKEGRGAVVKKEEKSMAEKITVEKVRAALAEKSRWGKQAEVKALIMKYGAKKLTDLEPACYEELLKDAEAL